MLVIIIEHLGGMAFFDQALAALKNDVAWIRPWDIPAESQQKILGGNLERLIADRI